MNPFLSPLEKWLRCPASDLRNHAFEAAQFAAANLLEGGSKADDARDAAIRLRAILTERSEELSDFRPLIDALTREVGLYPYLDGSIHLTDLVVREAFRSPTESDVIFHADQQRIFYSLTNGRNVVASAPTSFGKSLLIDSLIALEHVQRSAIIVPTLALLDETRKRLMQKFSARATIIFHRSQTAPASGKVVFIGTQERLLDREDIGDLDVLVVDEFYKADPSFSNQRFIALNAAISTLSRRSKQFFLIGPFIDDVDKRGWRDADVDEVITHFRTVAADTSELAVEDSHPSQLHELLKEPGNVPALVFVRSPNSASDLTESLLEDGVSINSDWATAYANWLGEHYSEKWSLVKALRHGFAYHHGRLPRSVASTLVRAFNQGRLEVLLCTSTLIEGVNTAAKSVIIWDKSIDGKSLDYFTFSNIRGRAGRMGRHYVGKVFHFHPEPKEKLQHVEVPGLGEGGDVDEILAHYDPAEVSPAATERMLAWTDRTGLNPEQLKRFSGLTFARLERLKQNVDALSEDELAILSWHSMPRYEQLMVLCDLMWRTFDLSRSGAKRHKQMTLFIWSLYKSGSLTSFMRRFLRSMWPSHPDAIFGFLRACEYNLPAMIMAAQESLRENRDVDANYSLLAAKLENWFLPGKVKALEEIGFPVIVFEKLKLPIPAGASVEQLLWRAVAVARKQRLSSIEMEMIESTIPRQLNLSAIR